MRDYLRVAFGTNGLFSDKVFTICSGAWSSRVFSIPAPRSKEQVKPSTLQAIRVALFPDAGLDGTKIADPLDSGPGSVFDVVRCEWNPKYGWKPNHNPAHLLWLERDVKRRIRYELTRNGKVLATLEMSGTDLRAAICHEPGLRGVFPPCSSRTDHRAGGRTARGCAHRDHRYGGRLITVAVRPATAPPKKAALSTSQVDVGGIRATRWEWRHPRRRTVRLLLTG